MFANACFTLHCYWLYLHIMCSSCIISHYIITFMSADENKKKSAPAVFQRCIYNNNFVFGLYWCWHEKPYGQGHVGWTERTFTRMYKLWLLPEVNAELAHSLFKLTHYNGAKSLFFLFWLQPISHFNLLPHKSIKSHDKTFFKKRLLLAFARHRKLVYIFQLRKLIWLFSYYILKEWIQRRRKRKKKCKEEVKNRWSKLKFTHSW